MPKYAYKICIAMRRDDEETPDDVVEMCRMVWEQCEEQWDANGEMPGGYSIHLERSLDDERSRDLIDFPEEAYS